MPWVKLDDHFPDHEKLARCEIFAPLCGWLYVCGLAYCNRQLTNGRIPKGHIHRLVSFKGLQVVTGGVGTGKDKMVEFTDDIDIDELARWLVAVGLWEEDEDDYLVHDYLDYQPSRDEVVRERQATKERVREWRGRKRGNAIGNSVSNSVSTLSPVPVPVVPASKEQKQGTRAPLHGTHKRHALCGQVCLPDFLLHDFVRLKGGDEEDARGYVENWWSRLDDELQVNNRPPIGDGAAYLRQRWAADHPTPKPISTAPAFDAKAWAAKGAS